MTAFTGYVDNTSMLAHYAMLKKIRDECVAEGWTELRYDTSIANRELIMMAPGMSSTEEYYVGVRTYQDSGADYYNLAFATFSGYVSGNSFDAQPGIAISGVPAHNQRIDYWMAINGQRLALAMKLGTGVYTSGYIGRFNAYSIPTQYPYPVIAAGMLNGTPATRFSDTAYSMGYKGNTNALRMRNQAGAWVNPLAYPWANTGASIYSTMRDTGAYYPLTPVMLCQSGAGIFGELDGIYHVSGFNNAVENTINIGGTSGTDYVIIRDTWRTGFGDYYALRMD